MRIEAVGQAPTEGRCQRQLRENLSFTSPCLHMDMIPTAKDIRGPSPLVAIENEAPARQMKKIEAVIVPSNLDAVRKELERRGIRCGMTVVDVQYSDSEN